MGSAPLTSEPQEPEFVPPTEEVQRVYPDFNPTNEAPYGIVSSDAPAWSAGCDITQGTMHCFKNDRLFFCNRFYV